MFGALLSGAALLAGCSPAPEPVDSVELEPGPAAPARFVTTAPVAPDDGRPRLIVFGDSLSAGYGLDPGLAYPDVLQELFEENGIGWRVVNLSISGDTTAGGASRLQSAVELEPDFVLLELGGNDGLRGMPISATRQNLERAIQTFQDAGAQVMLAGMTLPPNYGPDYISDFEQTYRDLADEYDLPLIPFLLEDMITEDLRYFQDDHIHPTAEGAEIVARAVYDAVVPELP